MENKKNEMTEIEVERVINKKMIDKDILIKRLDKKNIEENKNSIEKINKKIEAKEKMRAGKFAQIV